MILITDFFNTNYINPQEFNRIMQENYKYEMNQQKEIYDACKALNDFIDSVNKVDQNHKQQLFNNLLIVIGSKNSW